MRTAACLLMVAMCAGCRGSAPKPAASRRIDVHTHFGPEAAEHALQVLGAHGIDTAVNLSGGAPGAGLEEQLAAARRFPGRVIVFCTPDFRQVQKGPGYGERLADELRRAQQLGCAGMKIFKSLGLGLQRADGTLLPVDDPGLDPLFELAGQLKLPVAIHTGDPKAFWLPVTPQNERYAELTVHPGWSEYGRPVPTFDQLLDAFERRVARHPGTTFIGLHFGNDAEEPSRVGQMLDRHPNLVVDTAARVPELGRHPPDTLRDFFVRYQDRILFGTDLGVGQGPSDLALGSPGAQPPGPAEVERFFTATWRFFETSDRAFPHPTEIQGAWTIDGLGLPPDVLRKLYADNARRVLNLQ